MTLFNNSQNFIISNLVDEQQFMTPKRYLVNVKM